MGSGGKFREDKISTGTITTLFATIALVREALDNLLPLVARCGEGSTDPKDWDQLALWRDRLKLRSQALVTNLKGLERMQDKP